MLPCAVDRGSPCLPRHWSRWSIDQMDLLAIVAGLGVFVIAAPVFFILGRSSGKSGELRRQQEAKATAEELSKRIVSDAEREADNLKKTALVSGKEEVIKLREAVE